LDIKWSSPYVINSKDPGVLTYCIKLATDKVTGKSQPVTGKPYLQPCPLTPIGMDVNLTFAYFMDNPRVKGIPSGFNFIVSENEWDENPPILLSLNTDEHAPSGDYNITFTFTYGDNQKVLQDYKTTQFHVTNWWERSQTWIQISAVAIALISLMVAAIRK